MKKLFLFASAAAMFATSCSDDLGFKQETTSEPQGKCTLIASYPLGTQIETRTELVTNGSKKSYVWDGGDAIGVFNATNGDKTNAMFTYTQAMGEEAAQFNGDIYALKNTTYYAYYPYDPTEQLVAGADGPTLSLNILANQNFNHQAVKNASWELNPPSGSFSKGEAPAVAVGNANDDDELEMTFQPVASYFVFPITSYSAVTVTSLELSVTNKDGDDQVLAGSFNVNMQEIDKGYSYYEITTAAPGGGMSIMLDCGRGVELGTSANPTSNFWFVVPSGLQLEGATVTLKVNTAKNGTATITKTLAPVLPNVKNGVAGMNNIWKIVPESNTPWVFNTTDNFIIQTQAQFLEYVYLLTNGDDAINLWAEMKQKYPEMLAYSNFPNMVKMKSGINVNDITWHPDGQNIWAQSGINNVKNAQVALTLNFNPSTLASELNKLGLNLSATNVPKYYQEIYKSYVSNQFIPTVNCQFNDITISGATPAVQLNGLAVKGNGLFKANAGTQLTVKDLTLNNVKLTAAGLPSYQTAAYLVANGNDNVAVNNVTVNANCEVTGSTLPKALFENDYASYYNYDAKVVNTKTNANNNLTNYYYANNLYLQKVNDNNTTISYDFTPTGHQVANFNNIYLQYTGKDGRQGFGSILNVTGEGMAVSLMEKVVKNNTNTPYSVVSKEAAISYWTGRSNPFNDGTGWLAKGSSEQLATIVQNNTTEVFTSDYALNLMGGYAGVNAAVPAYWWTSPTQNNTVTVNGGKTGITVSQVHIDGTKDGKNFAGSVNLSLLGQASTVTNLTVKDINITYNLAAKHSLLVAAISAYPAAKSSAYVSGYTANIGGGATLQWNAAGGLYVVVTEGNVGYISGSFSGSATALPKDCKFGQAAGNLQFKTKSTPDGVTNPLGASCPNPFGIFDLFVTNPTYGSTAYFTLTNFPAGYNGENSIINATNNPTTTPTAQNNLIMNQVNGSTTVSAQWLSSYDKDDKVWYYDWYQDLTKPVTPPAN